MGVGKQALALPREGDAPVLEHVPAMAEPEGAQDILLDEENGEPARIDAPEFVEDAAHDHRRETQPRLVQLEEPALRPSPPADRTQLPFTPRKVPPPPLQPLPEPVEDVQH